MWTTPDPVPKWLPLMRGIVAVIFLILGPIRARGRYRVPREGGVLILSNHLADIDPVVVQAATPRRIYFMAKHELFEMKVIGTFMRWYRAFPVKRGEPDRQALKLAIQLLKEGNVVCIFPEGELSEGGDLLPILPGCALIIRQSGVPAICLGLRNTNRVMPYGSMIPRPAFRRLDALFGEPQSFDKHATTEEIVAWVDGQLRELTDQTESGPHSLA